MHDAEGLPQIWVPRVLQGIELTSEWASCNTNTADYTWLSSGSKLVWSQVFFPKQGQCWNQKKWYASIWGLSFLTLLEVIMTSILRSELTFRMFLMFKIKRQCICKACVKCQTCRVTNFSDWAISPIFRFRNKYILNSSLPRHVGDKWNCSDASWVLELNLACCSSKWSMSRRGRHLIFHRKMIRFPNILRMKPC